MRTIALWVVLIVLFVAFYRYFAVNPDIGAPLSGATLVLLVVVLFLVLFALFYLLARRWVAANDLGVSHLNAGELTQAKEQFVQAQKRAINKIQRAVAQYNLGMTQTELGELDAALTNLEAVERAQGLKQFSAAYHTPLPNHIALCHALKGNIDVAKKWLKEGDDRRGNLPMNFTLLPEAIVLARDGHPAAAANLLQSRWRHAESLSVRQFKMLKLVEALALHLEDPVKNQQRILEALGAAKPMGPATLTAMTQGWPELRDFLAARSIQAAA